MDFINFQLSDIGYIIVILVGILFLHVWYKRFKIKEMSRIMEFVRVVMTDNKVFKQLRSRISEIYKVDEKYTAFAFNTIKRTKSQSLKDLVNQYSAVRGLNFLDNKKAKVIACNRVECNEEVKNEIGHDSLFSLIADENNVLYILLSARLGDSYVSTDVKVAIFDLMPPMIISKKYMIEITRASINDIIIPEGECDLELVSKSSLKIEDDEIRLTIQWNKYNTIFLKYNIGENIFR